MKSIKDLKIGLFAYNFKHRKSQDFLIRAFLEELNVIAVFAADAVKLNIPSSTIKTKVRHQGMLHPRKISERFDYNYFNFPHNDEKTVQTIKGMNLDVGIVAGARILDKTVIDAFNIGIINYHPALIPEVRGLDGLLWSVINNVPLGVTAHLIDEQVDAGVLLLKQKLDIFNDDTIYDLSERLYEVQLDQLIPSLEAVIKKDYKKVDFSDTTYNRKMPTDLEKQVLTRIDDYIKFHSN